jgi:integrase
VIQRGDTLLFRFAVGSITVTMKVRYLKGPDKHGVYWYYRRIPSHAKAHLRLSKNFVRKSLGKDRDEAIKQVKIVNAEHQARWNALSATQVAKDSGNSRDLDLAATTIINALGLEPGDGRKLPWAQDIIEDHFKEKYGSKAYEAAYYGSPETYHFDTAEDIDSRLEQLLTPADLEARRRLIRGNQGSTTPYLSEALDLYLTQKRKGSLEHFAKDTRRIIGYVIGVVGDKRLDTYQRKDANAVRDDFLKRMKTESVARYFHTINAVIHWAQKEHGLTFTNHFSRINIADRGHDTKKREGFTDDERKALVAACRELADDRRCIIAMIADTGARPGEIIGLRVSDVHLSADIPYIHIQPYDGRSVKTPYSDREVPLVGEALWAARLAVVGKPADGLLFPEYGPSRKRVDSACTALAKWIKESLGIPKPLYCLRHSMQTRLVSTGCPENVQVSIGGWTDGKRKTHRDYGTFPLPLKLSYLERVVD